MRDKQHLAGVDAEVLLNRSPAANESSLMMEQPIRYIRAISGAGEVGYWNNETTA